MQLALLGLNHNSAPVEVREKLAISEDRFAELYAEILSEDRIYEALILSTCNRVEFYIVTDDYLCNIEALLQAVCKFAGVERDEFYNHSYMKCDSDTVTHLFRVAGGLDSLVLGEPQIFGQVKDAFEAARKHNSAGKFIRKLEEQVIKTTKKIRTYTGIGDNPVSVSYAAIELAGRIFGDLSGKNALVIGAGEMCELAARHLNTAGIGKITVTNRTLAKAEKLAAEFDGDTLEFDSFKEHLHEMDIIISSTGAKEYVVRGEDVKDTMSKRKHRPMFFIDIAVPRDIDPEINEIENIYVYDIDDLKAVVEENKKLRVKEAEKAMDYIVAGVQGFYDWLESIKIVPVIKGMRNFFEEQKELELKRFCDKMKIKDPDEIKKLDYLLSAYMNKVAHTPLTNLKNISGDKEKYSVGDAVKLLFDIKD